MNDNSCLRHLIYRGLIRGRLWIVLMLVILLLDISPTSAQLGSTSFTRNQGSYEQNDTCSTFTSQCLGLPFRFIGISNQLTSPTFRQIEIFFDDSAFTEQNLRSLFQFLSNRYPKPVNLTVIIITDWNQVPIRSNCLTEGVSETDHSELWSTRFHQATFFRRDRKNDSQYFRFNPDPKIYQRVLMNNPIPK